MSVRLHPSATISYFSESRMMARPLYQRTSALGRETYIVYHSLLFVLIFCYLELRPNTHLAFKDCLSFLFNHQVLDLSDKLNQWLHDCEGGFSCSLGGDKLDGAALFTGDLVDCQPMLTADHFNAKKTGKASLSYHHFMFCFQLLALTLCYRPPLQVAH